MTIYSATDLDLTNVPPPQAGARSRVGSDEKSRHPRLRLHRFMHRQVRPVAERLAKLERAVRAIKISIDPAWGAVALLVAVMLGGFTWLSTQGCSTLTGRVSESGLQHQRSEVEGLLRKRIPESAFV